MGRPFPTLLACPSLLPVMLSSPSSTGRHSCPLGVVSCLILNLISLDFAFSSPPRLSFCALSLFFLFSLFSSPSLPFSSPSLPLLSLLYFPPLLFPLPFPLFSLSPLFLLHQFTLFDPYVLIPFILTEHDRLTSFVFVVSFFFPRLIFPFTTSRFDIVPLVPILVERLSIIAQELGKYTLSSACFCIFFLASNSHRKHSPPPSS